MLVKVHLEGFDGDSVVSHGNERLYDLAGGLGYLNY